MSYLSIDHLQTALADNIFSHTADRKKAAGRAIGTMIELITYYLLNEWGLRDDTIIEMGLPEYGNQEITHNVEFTLHPLRYMQTDKSFSYQGSITANKIAKTFGLAGDTDKIKAVNLLDRKGTQKNACIITSNDECYTTANLYKAEVGTAEIHLSNLLRKPYAMFECKRVGVEEGCKKGPQTIEKAKQGAYVAKMTSSLQKIRDDKGELNGIIYKDGSPIIKPYAELLREIIYGQDATLLTGFTLSVGIVSNHGNWFTSNDQNKELKVLSQTYDWLLFLTDQGLAQFISDLLINPAKEFQVVKEAFNNSYEAGKKGNIFTKSKISHTAHKALCAYFHKNSAKIEKWFNVISPANMRVDELKDNLQKLKQKNWKEVTV